MKLSDETLAIIETALKHGDSVELKKEQGRLVVVVIKRQVKIKQEF